jgi:Fe-S-cluster containining protein
MRRVRIAIIGPSPCERCDAACCRQSAWPYAVLLQSDDERRRFGPWSESILLDDHDGLRTAHVIAYRDGRCPFLGADDRCTIYDSRPLSCRQFECTRRFGNDETFFHANPRVRSLLESL